MPDIVKDTTGNTPEKNLYGRKTENQRLPIGIQDFGEIRRNNCIYVDKTAHMYRLISEGKYYFLSRPRRFGKSLFLSTVQAYFEGKKELFEGTYIAAKETEWQQYPILKLDLNAEDYDAADKLAKKLDAQLKLWETEYPTGFETYPLGTRFERIITTAAKQTGHRAVVLVDEYDKPLLQAIGNKELQDCFRRTLKGFYGALKSCDAYIQFAMLTGVTKFGKVSVFSDLNNLNDITTDARFHDICGITETELKENFQAHIMQLAEGEGITAKECMDRLQQMYDGYHFVEGQEGLYNPFSLLRAFFTKRFGSYWFETGTPSYLVSLLQQYDYNLDAMQNAEVTADTLNTIDTEVQNPIPVIYQSGYLTIKSYDKEFGEYHLGFPNREVEEGFIKYLAPFYLSSSPENSPLDIKNFVMDVRNGHPEQFCQRLKSLFADTPYELVKSLENHYQNIVWIIFKLLGFYTQAEYHTSSGRIDLLVKTDRYIYVMEFKLNGTAEEALKQIKAKDYPLPFEMDSRKAFCIGINFSDKTRNIEKWIIE